MERRSLRATILEVLEVGGPRKPNVLRGLAKSRGEGGQYRRVIAALKRAGRIRTVHRYGGPHLALKP